MNDDFEAALLQLIVPRLRSPGYIYEPRLRLGDELFGFRKVLGDDAQAVVQFQRQFDGKAERFTVNVLRVPANEIHPLLYGGDTPLRAARLSYVLWYVYGLHDYSTSDFWWTASDSSTREVALLDAAEKIARYGAPWLEDSNAPKPWEMPASRADEFADAVLAVMAREMDHLGYRLERQTLSGDLPYCYFSKTLPDGTYALIELQAIYSLDPSEFNFDVRLQRRADSDPLAFNGSYGHWRSISLAQLVWQTRDSAPLERLSVAEVKRLFWHYRDRAELDAQLRDALAQIKQVGCAWVERAAVESKVIQ